MKRLSLIAPILLAGCGQLTFPTCAELRSKEADLYIAELRMRADRLTGDFVDLAEFERNRHHLIEVRDRFQAQCPKEYEQLQEMMVASRKKMNR